MERVDVRKLPLAKRSEFYAQAIEYTTAARATVIKALEADPQNRREQTQPELLSSLTKAAFWAGEYALAEKYANPWLEAARQQSAESSGLAPNKRLAREMDLGETIHQANSILGEIALSRGDTKRAGDYLIASGKVGRPSPVLASYGPDLALMRDLLTLKEKQPVLDFLDECSNFWKFESRPRGLRGLPIAVILRFQASV